MNQGHFLNKLPAPSLRDYIRHYTFVDVPFAQTRQLEFRALPSSNTRIVLFLNGSSLQKVENRLLRVGACALVGFYSRSHLFLPTQSLQQVMIHFTPWGAQPFLDFPLSDITDTRAELQYVFRDGLDELLEALQREGPEGCWKETLDAFFIKKLKRFTSFNRRGRQIVRHICSTHGKARLNELSGELFIGERTIQRLVHNAAGINFKFFSMLARMEYARHLLNRRQSFRLADAALQAGYFDQAHFIHEFQSVYGETPGEFLKRKHKMVWNRLER
ncbi:MAG: AraC family transcriptional regulator [Phaeodactylibacter sp.]|nr:AraC family transcriptional regulator [Phaeodactylibacter sp.]